MLQCFLSKSAGLPGPCCRCSKLLLGTGLQCAGRADPKYVTVDKAMKVVTRHGVGSQIETISCLGLLGRAVLTIALFLLVSVFKQVAV